MKVIHKRNSFDMKVSDVTCDEISSCKNRLYLVWNWITENVNTHDAALESVKPYHDNILITRIN